MTTATRSEPALPEMNFGKTGPHTCWDSKNNVSVPMPVLHAFLAHSRASGTMRLERSLGPLDHTGHPRWTLFHVFGTHPDGRHAVMTAGPEHPRHLVLVDVTDLDATIAAARDIDS